MPKYQVGVGWAVTKYRVGFGWAVTKYRVGFVWAVNSFLKRYSARKVSMSSANMQDGQKRSQVYREQPEIWKKERFIITNLMLTFTITCHKKDRTQSDGQHVVVFF